MATSAEFGLLHKWSLIENTAGPAAPKKHLMAQLPSDFWGSFHISLIYSNTIKIQHTVYGCYGFGMMNFGCITEKLN